MTDHHSAPDGTAPANGPGRGGAGRSVIVTGAASGMGRAEARLFAAEGAQVAVTDMHADGVHAVVEEISAAGGSAQGWVLDVTDEAQVHQVVNDAASAFGGLDIVVNNAGVSIGAQIDGDDQLDAWNTSLDVLLTGQLRMIRAALPHLRRSDAARIVNIASTEGLGATAYISGYTAAKHGVIGLTRSLAVELGPEAITVNCVCPGPVRTGMTAAIPDDAKAKYARRRTALHRYGDPIEVAHMVLSLALPAAGFTTGAVLAVDGGLTVRNA